MAAQVAHYADTDSHGHVFSACKGERVARMTSIPSLVTCLACKELGFGK